MSLTAYHAKYFAYDLTRRSVGGIDRLSMALFDASVDLNPHQIEAAVFALESPLSKGVILADEVGLGKTIEAGIVLCQLWAERKRRLLVICPASLRKQRALELQAFNGTLRAECLNAHWFGTLAEAKRLIEAWRQEYNESRPHRSLSDRTPTEFASEYAASRVLTAT